MSQSGSRESKGIPQDTVPVKLFRKQGLVSGIVCRFHLGLYLVVGDLNFHEPRITGSGTRAGASGRTTSIWLLFESKTSVRKNVAMCKHCDMPVGHISGLRMIKAFRYRQYGKYVIVQQHPNEEVDVVAKSKLIHFTCRQLLIVPS